MTVVLLAVLIIITRLGGEIQRLDPGFFSIDLFLTLSTTTTKKIIIHECLLSPTVKKKKTNIKPPPLLVNTKSQCHLHQFESSLVEWSCHRVNNDRNPQ